MQDPKTSQTRTTKPWYQRAIQMATLWRTISKSSSDHVTTTSVSSDNNHHNNNNQHANLWRSISKSTDHNNNHNRSQRLRKCTSLKVATSFTRVCLCAPISSYNEVLRADIPPRRSYSYPRSTSKPNSLTSSPQPQPQPQQDHQQLFRAHSARHSIEVRRVFRGKSLTDDVLMRRFVVEEEAMMQVKRRNEMEVIRKRNSMRRKKLGPSPLCRMVMAEEDQYQYQYQELYIEEKDQHQYY